jgi:LytS/YehU family sensor histidine kinase
VTLDLPDDLRGAGVPHFLLLPLIDTAIRHATSRTRAAIRIGVTAAPADAGRLLLTVSSDETPGADPDPAGEGAGAVRDRLRLLYGQAARLRIRRREGRVVAEIEMPLHPTG